MSTLIGKKPCVDVDGNYYAQTKIGKQTWMAENLKTTKYRDGSEIPTGYSNSEWGNLNETQTGATATASSGLRSFLGSLPKKSLTFCIALSTTSLAL